MFNFQPARKPQTTIGVAFNIAELVYHPVGAQNA